MLYWIEIVSICAFIGLILLSGFLILWSLAKLMRLKSFGWRKSFLVNVIFVISFTFPLFFSLSTLEISDIYLEALGWVFLCVFLLAIFIIAKPESALKRILISVIYIPFFLFMSFFVFDSLTRFASFKVFDGNNLEPFIGNGDITFQIRTSDFNRGDFVSYYGVYVRRIIGMPYDTVSMDADGQIFINSQMVCTAYQCYRSSISDVPEFTLGENEYLISNETGLSLETGEPSYHIVSKEEIDGKIFALMSDFSQKSGGIQFKVPEYANKKDKNKQLVQHGSPHEGVHVYSVSAQSKSILNVEYGDNFVRTRFADTYAYGAVLESYYQISSGITAQVINFEKVYYPIEGCPDDYRKEYYKHAIRLIYPDGQSKIAYVADVPNIDTSCGSGFIDMNRIGSVALSPNGDALLFTIDFWEFGDAHIIDIKTGRELWRKDGKGYFSPEDVIWLSDNETFLVQTGLDLNAREDGGIFVGSVKSNDEVFLVLPITGREIMAGTFIKDMQLLENNSHTLHFTAVYMDFDDEEMYREAYHKSTIHYEYDLQSHELQEIKSE